ncbi:sodium:proton antiporter [uncultured Alsobacter sp.]|uniref:sodium:proton antiporter n=1 Tax=uncultured Alsobacter sp. TaxID=1748258 RepID=UPI00345D40EE
MAAGAAAPAFAADGLNGATLGAVWALPFAGILLSIALFPLMAPHLWEHHQGKIAAVWAGLVIVPLALTHGIGLTLETLAHTLLLEYLPFILLLLALFTAAGGILISGNIHGSPATNTLMLTIGAVLASFIGTTGASMVMIRPMIRANDNRRHNAHVFVFFIFIVSNLGGALTPLGDPPLFLGFLKGVDFFWTTTHLAAEAAFAGAIVLAVFYLFDRWMYRHETALPDPTPDKRIRVSGLVNLALIGVVIVAILISASWKPGVAFRVFGVEVEWQNLLRDLVFVGVALASLKLTRSEHRAANGFSWGPIVEVAKLFAGIFVAMVPVLAMLRAGTSGAFAPLVALVTNPDGTPNNAAYFWLSGGLSSFLDNAPTYLVFFELAGGDAQTLMTKGALTLAAISCGAVFMGANSYIGNAPNFMVYAIARSAGVKMPSFFGYMVWSGAILIPTFILVTFVFFR